MTDEVKVNQIVVFSGGDAGQWRVRAIERVRGDGLPDISHVAIALESAVEGDAVWRLRGAISNTRYATRDEVAMLGARQGGLERPEARSAVLIPILKSQAWWDLAQDERRAIFEETSRHTRIGLDYLPAIARRLHHSRDLGEAFDFLTWFEFAPEHEADFDEMTARLRSTREWEYVEREVEIRLTRTES
ncbi:chlorite dismutase family protein [Bosea sp. PAMC 26642]|uniref:chlorite dismutase family protein n=1 Tax=Bosea sp. (strain PAMC 26642) TaxID=1792307 RepID=UPI00077025F4|nr:chlorite dismutase family protein [Bosea sp. PAMC 26642]AMJ63433.1 chlorite dismutase [Bosea sp. PAMC 26642]